MRELPDTGYCEEHGYFTAAYPNLLQVGFLIDQICPYCRNEGKIKIEPKKDLWLTLGQWRELVYAKEYLADKSLFNVPGTWNGRRFDAKNKN